MKGFVNMDLETYVAELKASGPWSQMYPDMLFQLGLGLRRLGWLSEALGAFEVALATNPQYLDAAISRCFLLGDLGRVSAAFRTFHRLQASGPDDFHLVLPLALFCLRHGWKKTGFELLLKAERLKPNLPYVALYVAAAHLEAGNADEAKKNMEKLADMMRAVDWIPARMKGPQSVAELDFYRRWDDPHGVKLLVAVAEATLANGDVDGAERRLCDAFSLFPGKTPVLIGLGRTAMAKGNPEEAERWFERAATFDSDCDEAHLNLAFLKASRGDEGGAERSLREAVRLRPLFPDYRYHYGLLLSSLSRTDEALEELRKALLLNPDYGHAALHLARLNLERGEAQTALSVLHGSSCEEWPEAQEIAAEASAHCLTT